MSLNIDHIRDTQIGHVDLVEFIKIIENPPLYYKMNPTINNGIHLVYVSIRLSLMSTVKKMP